jgi:hypothetical protein
VTFLRFGRRESDKQDRKGPQIGEMSEAATILAV